MEPIDFCAASLVTWRLTHLVHAENAPWGVAKGLRAWAKGRNFGVLECFLCASVWVALPVAVLFRRQRFLVLWPALSAAAIVIERATFPATFLDIAQFIEEQEPANVLRQE
jgi:hypothetical protein